MYTITDEVLNTSGQLDADPRYTIRDNSGNVLYDNVKVELRTPVSVDGTDINKATLEGIQTDLMNETKLAVVEYEATSAVSSIDIQNLNLVSDGGIYDVVIRGSGTSGGLSITLNNDTGSHYYVSGQSSAKSKIDVNLASYSGNYGIASLTLISNPRTSTGYTYEKIACLITTMTTENSSAPQFATKGVDYISSNNLTSLQISPDGSYSVAKGTKVWIYKRR